MICLMCGEKEVVKETDGYPGMCEPCVKECNDDAAIFWGLRKLGHSRHCAFRQIWGDGECECGKDG